MGFSNFKNTGSGGSGGTGATGATGPAGAAATIAVGTVTTGAAGSVAAVVNAGTSSAARFDFTIPRGEKGETGASGSGGAGGLAYKGVFDPAALYVVGEIVKYQDYLYSCKIAIPTIVKSLVNVMSSATSMTYTGNGTVISIPAITNGIYTDASANAYVAASPAGLEAIFPISRNFAGMKLYDSSANPLSIVTGVVVKIDGVVVSGAVGAYNATAKTYTISFPDTQGLKIFVGFIGASGQVTISEIELYEDVIAYPSNDLTHWDLFANSTTKVATMWAQKWSEKFILNNPADAYVSPSLPLTRDGNMTSMDFYVTGTPASATTITVKQNGVALSPAVTLSAAGKTTLTFAAAVVGAADDVFTYTVGGAGLAACVVTCNMKLVNR